MYQKGTSHVPKGWSEVYWPAWEMHCNNLRLVLRLGLVRVSSRVRVRLRVKVRVSVLVRVSIRTSWVVNFALFRCYRPVIYSSDHIIAQQANRYIVAFHIAISQYRTIRSGLLIMGGL